MRTVSLLPLGWPFKVNTFWQEPFFSLSCTAPLRWRAVPATLSDSLGCPLLLETEVLFHTVLVQDC